MNRECMIWTPDGVWLQTRSEGRLRSSWCGRLSLASVSQFCAAKRLDLVVMKRPDAGTAGGSGAPSRRVCVAEESAGVSVGS